MAAAKAKLKLGSSGVSSSIELPCSKLPLTIFAVAAKAKLKPGASGLSWTAILDPAAGEIFELEYLSVTELLTAILDPAARDILELESFSFSELCPLFSSAGAAAGILNDTANTFVLMILDPVASTQTMSA